MRKVGLQAAVGTQTRERSSKPNQQVILSGLQVSINEALTKNV